MAENTKSEENSKLKEDIMKNGEDDLDTLLDSEYLPDQFKCYKSAKVNLVSELWLIAILLYFPWIIVYNRPTLRYLQSITY